MKALPMYSPAHAPDHAFDATSIGGLGIDYLIDWKRTRLLLRPADPGYDPVLRRWVDASPDPPALLATLAAAWRVVAQLSPNAGLKARLEAICAALLAAPPAARDLTARQDVELDHWAQQVGELFMELQGDRPFTAAQPLELQVAPDIFGLISLLAFVRQARLAIRGQGEVPLAAPVRTRPELPVHQSANPAPPMVDVVEIGDLLDPQSRRGHELLHTELGDLASHLRWRWLHFPGLHTLPASRHAAEIADGVAQQRPDAFWTAISRLYAGATTGQTPPIEAVVQDLDVDGVLLARQMREGLLFPGVDRDRQMAWVCGIPYARPVVAVGRRVFVGVDQIMPLRQELQQHVQAQRKN
jgi:hypothetical protein